MSATSLAPRHSPLAPLLRRPWLWAAWVLFALGLPVALTLRRRLPPPAPVLGTLPPFRLTDEAGRPYGSDELRGKVWVADFIFTSCTFSCPRLTGFMARVQSRVRDAGDAVHLVSFSVDPAVDTPARLAEYGARYHADPRRWTFVTGALGDIQRVVTDGFRVLMEPAPAGARPAAPGFFDIVHGNQLVLVDGRGRIRGYYHADDEDLDRLARDVGLLVNRVTP